MKKILKNKIFILSIIILIIIGLYFLISYIIYIPKYPYTKEYIPGTSNIKGSVSTYKVKELEIGANKDGYAVFKNPRKALKYIKKNYKSGIKLIKQEFNLGPLTQFNYEKYKTYGWQVTKGTKEAQEEASTISSLLDIYENSYIKSNE